MTVTFTVEDGSLVTGANSYITVAEADDYIGQNQFAAPSWNALSTAEKEALLIWSTRYLDQRATWEGITTSTYLANPSVVNSIAGFVYIPPTVATPTQSLRWPRANAMDVDENPIPYNVIPTQLKQATAEMARYLIAQDRSLEREQDGLKELKLDVMTLVFRDGYQLPIVPTEIAYIIRGLGYISSGNAGFAKVRKA